MSQTLLVLAGDGIGPEVTAEAVRIAEHVAPDLQIEMGLIGGAAIDKTGTPISDKTLDRAREADAVLMGAVGGPKWAGVDRENRPEMGLLRLRKAMEVYANLRPAFCFPALSSASTLKPEFIDGLDIMIVRELTGGVYFGEPRGIDDGPDGIRRGYDTSIYTSPEIERVARVAFDIARGRQRRVCSVDKSNVMESGLFWRNEVGMTHEANGVGVALSHMYADACAMELVREPKQFDVILAGNLFGDILSDAAAMLTGSIGMLPSAAIGHSAGPGLYEPVHGSAPDIAGRSIANPCAAILSLEMAFRWSLDRVAEADKLFSAVSNALDAGARTRDLGGTFSTQQMGDAILQHL